MRTIFKYQLALNDIQTILMPEGAKILSANMQDGKLYIWAEVVHQVGSNRAYDIRIVGTGNRIMPDENLEFIATVIDRPFVWHVFLVVPAANASAQENR